ncbi:very short patch repair endonuclease [Novosphingobium sp. JCM 18896]|uniref:very short patch repair endonuclease n=1 Tax=Novosphingobium sp. JCM 18896 TaxID=2989731 RepID=UPI0022227B99|nr:DNA mismatch endonuclease Vsr [Novosphingobium sp. JCM 18896]MCW1432016.1 DNA mismatch endonuclease Vsr [Novosphingobium sp. JCM 18896]
MVDTLTPAQRSERMSRIRSRDTKPEVALRRELHRLGFRFRLHGKHLAGKPDIVLPKYRTVIFVHGCFWHRHQGCKVATTPKSNTEFWIEKFNRNVERDGRNLEQLRNEGWNVIVVWECEINTPPKAEARARSLDVYLRGIVS